MYVPEKLKLNKFRLVRIPRNREYFGKFGKVNPSGSYADPDADVIPTFQQKLDAIAAEFEQYRSEMEGDS